ncbi:MAG: agmatine deiminase [Synergistaceae bacterium]|nr:agmatine deiminase [Synergistaceae bacterium]
MLATIPKQDNFYMPAEYETHEATCLIWPTRAGSWGKNPVKSQIAFTNVIKEIAKGEKVYLICDEKHLEDAKKMVGNSATIIIAETDDSWARDVCPTFLTNGQAVRGVNWQFNAWGGDYDGLYASWKKDNALAPFVCHKLGLDYYDASHFILEGGSIHSDGEGTIVTTEACLLSKGRNSKLSKIEIEENLKNYLGAQKILWLPRGIAGDETNEHVDNICAFIDSACVVLATTDNKNDIQYEPSQETLEYLKNACDVLGQKIKIVPLPIPDYPITLTKEDCDEYVFEEGEDKREIGERLAASYVNFYFCNNSVLVPQFGGKNEQSDKRALQILSDAMPHRKIIGIDAIDILKGGGNIHCITQQIPGI